MLDRLIHEGNRLGLPGLNRPDKSALRRTVMKARRLLARARTKLEGAARGLPSLTATTRHGAPGHPDAAADAVTASRVPPAGSHRRAIVVHAGMPRTATTALQNLLASNPAALHEAGIVYPSRWRTVESAHHPLMLDVLSGKSVHPLEAEFLRFLDTETADVIISSEAAIYGFGIDRRRPLVRFLRALKGRRRVTLVFALRRLDEYAESVYCQEIRSHDLALTPEEYVNKVMRSAPGWFETLQLLGDTLTPDSVRLVKFERSQLFIERMLNALGLTAARYRGPRVPPVVNETFSLKSQIALAHHRRLFQELGLEVSRDHLYGAVQNKRLRFAGDRERYPVLSDALARRAHEAALQAAAAMKFTPYLDFFANEVPPARGEPVSFDFGILTDEDKGELRSVLCELAGIKTPA